MKSSSAGQGKMSKRTMRWNWRHLAQRRKVASSAEAFLRENGRARGHVEEASDLGRRVRTFVCERETVRSFPEKQTSLMGLDVFLLGAQQVKPKNC